MTREEFRQWLHAYAAAYHGAQRYLADPDHGKARAESMFAQLGHLDVEVATDALDRMRSDPRPVPFEPGEHAKRIMEHAEASLRATTAGADCFGRDPILAANMKLIRHWKRLRLAGRSYDEINDELADLIAEVNRLERERYGEPCHA